MSNDDHKKAPQSPEEMLAMIGKREDMVARGGDEGEDSGQARGPETVAREEIAKGPPETPIQKRPIGSPFEGLDLTLEDHEEAKGSEDDTENHDPLADLREKYKELCGDVLPPSGYRTPEENEAAQDTADSEEDQDRCSGKTADHTWYSGNGLGKKRTLWQDREATIPVEEHGDPIGCVRLSIDGQPVKPLKPPEPDADVMGYLHSRYDTEPQMRRLRELYDVRLSTVRLAFESPKDGEWYYENDTTNSFDCGYIYGELSDACDHVDQIAREILQDDLTHF